MEKFEKLPDGHVVAEEIAIEDLKSFLSKKKKKEVVIEEIKSSYPDLIEAIQLGRLTFPEDSLPKYELNDPIKNASGGVEISTINFKTRILASEQRKIASGIDLKKDTLLFAHKCMAHIVGQPLQMLDNFSESDYKVVDQLATVFI